MLDTVRSPTFFPYALTQVCPHWSAVLSSTPEFWTCVAIFIDTTQKHNSSDSTPNSHSHFQ
ncbi:hypothetical protein CPB84DRAFT_1687919, partial [Gymnopilus junonius]